MYEGNTTNGCETMGLDISDRFITTCLVDESGEVAEQGRIRTTPEALAKRFSGMARTRIVLEVGTHSPWISRQLESWGHEVIVANARRVKMIWAEDNKSDEVDAEALARLGRSDPTLLRPIRHRGEQASAHRSMILSRTALTWSSGITRSITQNPWTRSDCTYPSISASPPLGMPVPME